MATLSALYNLALLYTWRPLAYAAPKTWRLLTLVSPCHRAHLLQGYLINTGGLSGLYYWHHRQQLLFYDFLQNIKHLPKTYLQYFVVLSNTFQLCILLYLHAPPPPLPRSPRYCLLLLRIDFVTFRGLNLNILFLYVNLMN